MTMEDVRAVGALMGYRLEFILDPGTGEVDKRAFVLYTESTKLAEGYLREDESMSLTPFVDGAAVSWDDADFELDQVISDFRKLLVALESFGVIDSRGSIREAIRLTDAEDGEESRLVDSVTNPIDSLRHSTSGALEGYIRLLLQIDLMGSAYQARLAHQNGHGAVAVGLFGKSWFTFYGFEYPNTVYADGDTRESTSSAYLSLRQHELRNGKTKGPMHAVAALEGEFDWVLSMEDLIDLFTPGFDGAEHN